MLHLISDKKDDKKDKKDKDKDKDKDKHSKGLHVVKFAEFFTGGTPQLCSPLTAMLNRPTTHPKKTDL